MAKVSKGRNNRIAKIDAKGRVLIPATLRKGFFFGQKLYLTAGSGPCILLFTEDQWTAVLDQFQSLDPLSESQERDKLRMLQGYMEEVEIDAQGRILIPGHLMHHADIHEEVLFLRLSRWTEIWNPTLLEEKLEALRHGGSH